jgi:hypothetical protein
MYIFLEKPKKKVSAKLNIVKDVVKESKLKQLKLNY